MNAAREQDGPNHPGHARVETEACTNTTSRRRRAKDSIPGDDGHVPFEQAAAFIRIGSVQRIDVSTTESILGEAPCLREHVFETLASRWWSLVIADPDAPDLVTCDHPVTVVFKDQSRRGPIGYGLPGTEVSFPLGPRHALVGVLENPLRPQFTARPTEVAALNSRTVHHADRQVYARSPHAVILQRGGMADFNVVRNQ